MELPKIYKEVNVYNKSNKHLGVGVINKASESNRLILFTEAGTLTYCKSEVESEFIIRDWGKEIDYSDIEFNGQGFRSTLSAMQINQTIEIVTGDFIERIGEDEYCLNSDDRPFTKWDLINNLISIYNS